MRILAFDFGTKTGWASLDDNIIESGVQEFPLERGESPGMRFLRFNSWLAAILKLTTPDFVVYERAHHRGGFATDLLVGMITRLQEQCARLKIEYEPVHSATLKKWATGCGRADKEMMKKRASEIAGRIFMSDDEADVYLVLMWAREHLGDKLDIAKSREVDGSNQDDELR